MANKKDGGALKRCRGIFAGFTTLDIVHFLPSFPERNEKTFDEASFVGAGGPATNAAITFAALGGNSQLFSSLGQHPVSSLITAELSGFGTIHTDTEPERTTQPTIASIIVSTNNGDRCVVTSTSRPSGMPRSDLLAHFPSEFDFLLIDGHDLNLAVRTARFAKDKGALVILDAGSWKDGTQELLEYVDYAILSEKFCPPDIEHGGGLFGFLHDTGIIASAVTCGERDIRFSLRSTGKGTLKVPRIRAIDTLAAGDIFHGAYCYAFSALGLQFVESLQYASYIASESCRYLGPRKWISYHTQSERQTDAG